MSATTEPHQGLRRHKLLPADARAALPPLGAQDGAGLDATVHVKFFSPLGRYTFYVTEFDGEDILYGYVLSPLGDDCDEWGEASFREIAEAFVRGIPAIERDCYWTPCKMRECDGVKA